MGGRGGGSRASALGQAQTRAQAPAPVSLANDPEREYRKWFNRPYDITADIADTGNDREVSNIIFVLPDRNARMSWDGKAMIVRDNETDQILPFKAKTANTVFKQVSRYYGRKVKYTNPIGAEFSIGSDADDLRSTPAARKYGMGR